MNRWIRTLATTTLLAAASWAQALTITPYSAQALAAAQQAGQPVAVHFHADWCPTCKQQEKALTQLKAEPGLDISVLVADYDLEKDLRKAMKVRTSRRWWCSRATKRKPGWPATPRPTRSAPC